MKRILFIVITLTILALFAGCSEQKPTVAPSPTADISAETKETPTLAPESASPTEPARTLSPLLTPTPTATIVQTATPTPIQTAIPTAIPTPIQTAIPILKPTPTEPTRTLSPIYTPTPTPSATPVSTPKPQKRNDTVFYSADIGDGEYAYAWSEACPISAETIQMGTKSKDVNFLQSRLNELGFYTGTTTGTLNDATMTAVNDFRLSIGLEKEDYVSSETIALLYSPDGIEEMTVSELQIEKGSLEGLTVFLDAGHGGKATGTARGSLVEKYCVMDITDRLERMLTEAGARVILTRNGEENISLTYRSAITNVTMLNDLLDLKHEEIEKLREKIDKISLYSDYSEARIQTELLQIENQITAYLNLLENKQNELAQLSTYDEEYSAVVNEINALKEEGKSLSQTKELLTTAYYVVTLGIKEEEYTATYQSQIDETEEYCDKIEYYISLFDECLADPTVENSGIYERFLDENGIKYIGEELKEVLDLSKELFCDSYVFLSIHVNGVDNAESVNGTEIYIRNSNKDNSAYGINRRYYFNYCTEKRSRLASAMQTASTAADALSNGKTARIKDSDLFVLREINIPCILLETGYVTNEYDRTTLQNPNTRYKFAYMLYEGLKLYWAE